MLAKINAFLSGIPMTIVGGLSLFISLLLSLSGRNIVPDPAWLAVFICGIPLVYLAIWRIKYNPGISKISSALLISIGMFAAIAIGDLFAAGEVAFIMSVGSILEDKTTERARKGLRELIELTPQQGRRIKDGKEEMISASEIREGDLLRILPGEAIPVDGFIEAGNTSVDEKILTGESLPVDKGKGDDVFCGTLNRFGSIDIRASHVGEDSSLQKLIRMVEEADQKKAPMARIADQAASYLVPIALLVAILTGILTGEIERAVTILVVFCPCALILATPTAIMAAIGQATKHGVIIKSGEALEKMGKVDTIAFDKTGTLTYGDLQVSDILPLSGICSKEELLAIAASAERYSEHPLAKAIGACAKEQNIPLGKTEEFHMEAGRGVYARVNGEDVFCGNERFLNENGIVLPEKAKALAFGPQSQGKASILVARKNHIIGIIALSDVLRSNAKNMTKRLGDMGTSTILLTGDTTEAARYFADQAGITSVRARLLPGDKVKELQKLQEEHHRVCMVGDGVNDAPALKTAEVGVAMGIMGSDLAVEAADIALMGDDLSKIPYLKWLSDTTVKTIRFGITLSMCINAVAVTLSIAGVLNPTTGALVHNCGSCLVVLIAALLYDRKYRE